jgi:hypothetical protein
MRSLFQSANQLYRSFDTGISFAEFVARMNRSFGENFFQKYENGELNYEQIRSVVLQKPMFSNVNRPSEENLQQGRPNITNGLIGVNRNDQETKTENKTASNVFKTILILGALAYIGYRIYKSKKA